jgi:hypothetical protein
MTKKTTIRQSTIAIWGGEQEHAPYERATQVPVVHSVSFGYDDIDIWHDVALGKRAGHIYSRNTNPTVRAFEEKTRDLEGAEAATSFSSGMAAISNTFFTFLRPGDRVVSIKDSYGGTNRMFTEFLPAFGIKVALCATSDHAKIEAEVARSPTSPGCRRRRTRPAPWSRSTTPSPRRSTRTRWRSAPTSSSTAPPSSSAGMPTRSAASSAAARNSCGNCSTSARSTARCWRRWTPTTCCAA